MIATRYFIHYFKNKFGVINKSDSIFIPKF